MNSVSNIINKMIIRERGDSRFEGRITVNGKRKSFYGNTKTEVKNKAKTYLLKIENGFIEPQYIVFNEYIEYWLKTYKLNRIQPSSYCKLERVYRCQIKNTIGKKYIGNITTKDIQELIDNHANPPNKSNIKPLAMSGLKRIYHLLNPCLKRAVSEEIIQKNPCDDVILPIEECIQIETKEQFSLSDEDINNFKSVALEKYKGSKQYKSRDGLILLIILNTGMRMGEMLALEWKDINIKEKTLNINKTMQSDVYDFENHTVVDILKKNAKTSAGKRVLPLNDSTIFSINELIEYDKYHNIKCDYVCCTRANTRQTSRNLQRSLKRLRERTNIANRNDITLHTLRHTFGSVLIRRGVGIEVVSKLMGHANITITYNKYIHVLQEQQAKAMNLIQIC